MRNKSEIRLHGASLNIVRQCGPALKDVIQSKFGCMVQIEGVHFERDPSIGQWERTAPDKRFSTQLPSGVMVSVYKGDLVYFQGDAVVNAANEHLEHGGGLAQALSNAGGPQIQMESKKYIKEKGSLQTGDAVVTGSGSLPCHCIIHAVGPKLFSMRDLSKSEPLLEKAITSVLDIVEKRNLKNVAIPAVSSGIFRFPLPECADTIVRAVKKYYENPYLKFHPEEIVLMNHDEPTVKEMERACRDILGPNKVAARQRQQSSRNKPITHQLGSTVLLILKTGNIEDQKIDVIVNTTSPEQNLNSGMISKAIFQRAGNGMQAEIKTAPKHNHVIITKPYKLDCREVFHTQCSSSTDKDADKIFSRAVSESLRMAATNGHKSIAFPAIGTGHLGFSNEKAARIMTEAVIQFSKICTVNMEVRFVIYPANTDTFKAFAAQIEASTAKASHLNSSPAGFENLDDAPSSRSGSPRINLSSSCEETIYEAERWLNDHIFNFSESYITFNNFIQHFGMEHFNQLSCHSTRGVSVKEFFETGHGSIQIKGHSVEAVAVVAVHIEAMLCEVQNEFVNVEMRAMEAKEMSFERKTLDCNSVEVKDRKYVCRDYLRIFKVETLANPTLKMIFDQNKRRLNHSHAPQKMYQRIPAQFCGLLCQIGFHVEYAPPQDPKYGEGIYFAGSVKTAMELWGDTNEEYVYLVEAEVLTGKAFSGKRGLIAPPAVGEDPFIVYNSVHGGSDVSVIFSGCQALPTHIITCKKL